MTDDDKAIPSRGFAKLDSGIVDSTVWTKEHDYLRVWIALLAKCDSYGVVRAAPPAMAHLCFVTLERFEEIINDFCSPDKHSRTSENEGRRLEQVEGGWVILNYLRYRDLVQRKAMSHAERQAAYRRRLAERDYRVTRRVTSDTEAEAEAEADTEAKAFRIGEEKQVPSVPPSIDGEDSAVRSGRILKAQIEEVWERHLKARRLFFARKNGKRAGAPPDLTEKVTKAIRLAIREHGLAKAKAAGVGIFYSDFHRGENKEGRAFLDPMLCWRMKDVDNVERFALLAAEKQPEEFGDAEA